MKMHYSVEYIEKYRQCYAR